MQGFLFSKPLQVGEFLDRLGAQQAAIPNRSNA
jgi:sensor c-di-GMP phosphodiesterase-like protein